MSASGTVLAVIRQKSASLGKASLRGFKQLALRLRSGLGGVTPTASGMNKDAARADARGQHWGGDPSGAPSPGSCLPPRQQVEETSTVTWNLHHGPALSPLPRPQGGACFAGRLPPQKDLTEICARQRAG